MSQLETSKSLIKVQPDCVIYKDNYAFLRGETNQISYSQANWLYTLAIGSVVSGVVAIFLLLSTSLLKNSNQSNVLSTILPGILLISMIMSILAFGLWLMGKRTAKMLYVLEQTGQLLQGKVTRVYTKYGEKRSGAVLVIEYEVTSPTSGLVLLKKASLNRLIALEKGFEIPVKGATLAILYRDDQTFTAL